MKYFFYFFVSIVIVLIVFLIITTFEFERGRYKARYEFNNTHYSKIISPGAVDKLTVLPLVDYYSDNNQLKTEIAVSYLIKADNYVILLDAGGNIKNEHPSPLIYNMQKLGIKASDINMIFISHVNGSHIGQGSNRDEKSLSLSRGNVDLGDIPVYAPDEITPSKWNPKLKIRQVTGPEMIKPGIATIGRIPEFLFFLGLTYEQCLAINVKGKGLVLIIGCGHPGLDRIFIRTKQLFNEKIYGVIGGLHLMVNGGRFRVGPFELHKFVSGNLPWRGPSELDVQSLFNLLRLENIRLISLSPHDTSDWALEQFSIEFKNEYVDLKVGKEIIIQ